MQNWAGSRSMIYCWVMPLATYSVFIILDFCSIQCKFNHMINAKEELQITNGMLSFLYISQIYKKGRAKINCTSSL